ncbi:MAG: hypothetical protein CMG78_12060 [Marinobacter sp.]|nr:hypothetical protein [Marinobacter sp.]
MLFPNTNITSYLMDINASESLTKMEKVQYLIRPALNIAGKNRYNVLIIFINTIYPSRINIIVEPGKRTGLSGCKCFLMIRMSRHRSYWLIIHFIIIKFTVIEDLCNLCRIIHFGANIIIIRHLALQNLLVSFGRATTTERKNINYFIPIK